MKLMKNKKFLILALITLLISPFTVLAEENDSTASGDGTSINESNESGSSENESGETGGEVEQTPSASPTPTPTSTPTPTPVPSDGYLKNLKIDYVEFNEKFEKTTQEYTATVPSATDEVIISAIPEVDVDTVECNKPTTLVDGKFKVSLNEGENTFEMRVKTQSGKTTIYTLRITRATSKLNLKSFELVGTTLNEVFDPELYEYTVDVPYTVETVSIKEGSIKTEDENAKVTVTGGDKLKVGSNNILKITVKNEARESKEYIITITRGTEDELMGDDAGNGVISSDIKTSEEEIIPAPDANQGNDNKTNSGNTLTYVLVVIICLLLLTIGIIGIYFFVKTKEKSEKSKQKRIAKLKKKQAKIEEELTGLMPIITPEVEEEHFNKKPKIKEEINQQVEQNLEDTIELEVIESYDFEEEKTERRNDKNVLEEFEDLFLDE